MKKLFIILLSVVGLTTAGAEEIVKTEEVAEAPKKAKVNATLGIDLVNQYIWRGLDIANASFQPTLGIDYKGLSLTAWGSVGFVSSDDAKEFDLTLDYTYKGFSVGLTDYWFFDGDYFQYRSGKTTHVFEGYVGYDFKYVSAKWFTNFAGNDGLNGSGNRAFSSYFEIAAPFRLATLDWQAALGIVPWRTTYYNNSSFTVTNISLRATKDFVFKEKYHLPVFVGITANPNANKVYILCGVGFKM